VGAERVKSGASQLVGFLRPGGSSLVLDGSYSSGWELRGLSQLVGFLRLGGSSLVLDGSYSSGWELRGLSLE
jgi:hypothetical protein